MPKTKMFASGSSVVSVEDNTRKLLILIEGDSTDAIFNSVFILNFESSDNADYQINKNIMKDFIYTAFGHSVTMITIHGLQTSNFDSSSNGMRNITRGGGTTPDIEEYYRKHCISSSEPKILKITTGTGDVVSKPSVYRGYMVAFSRKPMGEDKIQGYGFSITFVCERLSDQ